MDTTKSVDNASASTKAIGWFKPFVWIRAAIQQHPFVTAAFIFVGAALVQAFLQEQYSINYACLQLTDTDVSVVYPDWLARDGSQQQAPIVLQLGVVSTCAEEAAFSVATNTPDSTGASRPYIATPISLIINRSRQATSPLIQPMPTQPPAPPVSLVVDSGLEVAVVQGLDLSQSSPFTLTLDASNPEQTLIVSYLPGLPEVSSRRSVAINGQELPIALEQGWQQWARLVLATLFGPAGVALTAIGFFLVVWQEDRKQREVREIAELEKAAEKCANNRLSASELLNALERLIRIKSDSVGSIAHTFADYSITALRANPWDVFEDSTRWEQGLQRLSAFVRKSVLSADNIRELLAWYEGYSLSASGWGKAPQWNDSYLIGFAWNWRWRELAGNPQMNGRKLSDQWQSLKDDKAFMLGVLASQAVLEKAQRAEELKRSFLNDARYVISKSTKEAQPRERLANLSKNIDDDLKSWIKEDVAQEQNDKLPESLAKEMAEVVTDLIYARKIGHQRAKSEKNKVPFARFLWPLDDNPEIGDPNYTYEPDTIETPLGERMLDSGSLVIFRQPKSGSTGMEDAERESTKLRISLQYQLTLKLQECKPVLPVFAYLPATLIQTENVEHTTLFWLCRCVANEVVSYLCEEPANRFVEKFSGDEQEHLARLLATIGYDVAAGGHCLFQPVPDAELLDVDAYYGSLLRTDSYWKLRPLLDAAKLQSTWMERPKPANMLGWTKTLLRIAGFKKAIVLVDNLEQPLARGAVTAAEYAQALSPLLANGPLLAEHQMDLLMFFPAAIKPELEWRGVCFIDDTDLTAWLITELKFATLEAAGFQFVLW